MAVAAVANSIEGFSPRKVTPQRVQKWIDKNRQDSKYYRPLKAPSEKDAWTDNVHGAHFLEALFTELSKGKVTFDKTDHSVALTQWVVENSPEDLFEITKLLTNVLGGLKED